MAKKITHTHTRLELVMLKAALGKYEGKIDAAITALRAAGLGTLADEQADDLHALVGDVGDREGTTLDRVTKLVLGMQEDGVATLDSTKLEAHAYEVGLPLLGRRLRTMEGELRSFGRDDVGEWLVEQANHVSSTLKDHYAEQLPLKKEKTAEAAQPALVT